MLSDGSEIENPRFLTKALARLRKAQRRLSRKMKGSNNRKIRRQHPPAERMGVKGGTGDVRRGVPGCPEILVRYLDTNGPSAGSSAGRCPVSWQ
jgi:hypothetical protein